MTGTAPLAPWTRQQLLVGLAVAGSGGLALAVAWRGSASEAALSGQVGWLNIATMGLVVAMCAGGGLLLFGRRAIGVRRRRLLAGIKGAAPEATTPLENGWTWVAGTKRAHRSTCTLVRNKAVETITAADVRHHSLQRCEVCRP